MQFHGAKPPVAVLSGPTRSFEGWALVRLGKLSRAARRYVVLRASTLAVCATEHPRSQQLVVALTGASISPTQSRYECLVRAAGHRIWIQWTSDTELRVCRAAFEFANRRVDQYYRLVTHRQLGKGRSSEVVFAFDTATGDHAAVKIMNKDKARSTDREFAEKEVLIRMTIQHPTIVQTLDIFESPYDLFVVMELMAGGPLDRRLVKHNTPLSEHEARLIMCRLFAALTHLHSRRIAHRNVKPQNIFLDFSDDNLRWPDTAKLSDFSLACVLDDPDSSRHIVGTPEFLAPEASFMTTNPDGEREVIFGTEVDMWAAGVTLYNLLSLELPFEGEYPPDVFKRARSGKLSFSRRAFANVSPEAISLIKSLLNVDRRKRPTAETVMLHNWFRDPDYETQQQIDDLAAETNALALTINLTGFSDGLARFRRAALAVRVVIRLFAKTPGVHLQPVLCAGKGFQFNVSGIDIAPIKSTSGAAEDSAPSYDTQRTSIMVLSRISTSSTVKTRSSIGGDSVTGPTSYGFARTLSNDSRVMASPRSDKTHDVFPRSSARANPQSSFGSGGVAGVHRLLSDNKAGHFGSVGSSGLARTNMQTKTGWRWRRRSQQPPSAEH